MKTLAYSTNMVPNAKEGPITGVFFNVRLNSNPGVVPNSRAVPNTREVPNARVVPNTTVASNTAVVLNTRVEPNMGLIPNTRVALNTGVVPNTRVAPNTGVVPNTRVALNTGVVPNTRVAPNTGVVPKTLVSPNTGVVTNLNIADVTYEKLGPNIHGVNPDQNSEEPNLRENGLGEQHIYLKTLNYSEHHDSDQNDSNETDSDEHDTDGNDLNETDSDEHGTDGNDSDETALDEHGTDRNDSNEILTVDSNKMDFEKDKLEKKSTSERNCGSASVQSNQSSKLIQTSNINQTQNLSQSSKSDASSTFLGCLPCSDDEDDEEMCNQNRDFNIAEEIRQLANGSKRSCMELYREAKRLKTIKIEKEKEYRLAKEMWLKADRKANDWTMDKEEVLRILKTRLDPHQGFQSQQVPSPSLPKNSKSQQGPSAPSPSLLSDPQPQYNPSTAASQASTISFFDVNPSRNSSSIPASVASSKKTYSRSVHDSIKSSTPRSD